MTICQVVLLSSHTFPIATVSWWPISDVSEVDFLLFPSQTRPQTLYSILLLMLWNLPVHSSTENIVWSLEIILLFKKWFSNKVRNEPNIQIWLWGFISSHVKILYYYLTCLCFWRNSVLLVPSKVKQIISFISVPWRGQTHFHLATIPSGYFISFSRYTTLLLIKYQFKCDLLREAVSDDPIWHARPGTSHHSTKL